MVLQAILITLIGLCESVSIAKTVALRYKYDIDANQVSVYQRQPLPWLQHCACTQGLVYVQEMLALSVANLFASFFGA